MFSTGILASELIKVLQAKINNYGDRPCYVEGEYELEAVTGVEYIPKEKVAYQLMDCFKIYWLKEITKWIFLR